MSNTSDNFLFSDVSIKKTNSNLVKSLVWMMMMI